jgi:hypothetical protein
VGLCALLNCLHRKIAELEKQVQLLASVVNTRGQSTTIPTPPCPATSFGTQITGDFAAALSDPASNGWQGPRDPPNERNHSLATFPTALSPVLTHTTPITSPEHIIVRPPAIMPRTIETLQLSPNQIDSLFQM